MTVVLKPNSDGSLGLQGQDLDEGGFIAVTARYTSASVDEPIFVANRAYVVKAITGRVEVAGTDAGAVSASIKKVASGTAGTSGTALHSGSFNLKGTAATNQALTLSATSGVTSIPAGSALFVDYTGTLTAAVGCISVTLAPA